MNHQSQCDPPPPLDDYILPLQLPGLSLSTPLPIASSPPPPPPTPTTLPLAPPPPPLRRKSSFHRQGDFLGVILPNPSSDMPRRQSTTARASRPSPTLPSTSSHPPAPSKASYGTRSSNGVRATASTAAEQPPPPSAASLKVVLKRAKGVEPPPPTPVSDSSVPVLTLDSTSSSRSISPVPPALSTSAPSPAASTSGSATSSNTHALPSNGRTGQKNGKDGLNRVCHHHKNQTDRPRMTCINAPECKTMWCNVCVDKYYIACTPLSAFEDAGTFACPVCLDSCLCASCKRKRKSGRGSSLAPSARSVSVGHADEDEYAAPPPVAVEGERRKKKKKKDRKGKGKAVKQDEEDDEEMLPPPPVEEDVLDPPPTPELDRGEEADGEDEVLEEEAAKVEGEGAVPPMIVDGEDEALPPDPALPLPDPSPAPTLAPALTLASEPASASTSVPAPAPSPAPKRASLILHPPAYPSDSEILLARPSASTSTNPLLYDPLLPPAPPPPSGRKPPNNKGKKRRKSGLGPPKSRRRSVVLGEDGEPLPPKKRTGRPKGSTSAAAAAARAVADPCGGGGDSAFNYGHPLSASAVPIVPLVRPRRNKRPSTAFDDYAVDFQGTSAPVFNERVGQPTKASGSGSGSHRRQSAPAPSYPSREELLQQSKRQRLRTWRTSGISSASSCGEVSYDEESDEEDDDAVILLGEGGVRAEEPLPVLAGLERNLGIEGAEGGEDDEDAFGEGGVNYGEMFGVGTVLLPVGPVPSVEIEMEMDEGGEVKMEMEVTEEGEEDVKPKVKWIEGPERRKRRAAAAAAAASGSASAEPSPAPALPPPSLAAATTADETLSVSSSTSTATSTALKRRPTPVDVLPSDGGGSVRPFGSPVLTARPTLLPIPDEPPSSSSSALLLAPPNELSSLPSLVPTSTPTGLKTEDDDSTLLLLPLPSSSCDARPTSAPAPSALPPSSSSSSALAAVGPKLDPSLRCSSAPLDPTLVNRSADDAKLAFALLDAVRAAVRSAPSDGTDPSIGVAAALAGSRLPGAPHPTTTTSLTLPPSPSLLPASALSVDPPPITDLSISDSHSSLSLSSSTSTVLPSPSASPSSSSSSTATITIAPLEAQRLEAERRSLALAATAVVDPGKAFRRTARMKAESQFFVVGAAMSAGLSDEEMLVDEEDELGPSASVRGARETSEAAFANCGGAGGGASRGGFEYDYEYDYDSFVALESPLLVEDLWTPSSAAETSMSTSASTAPSSLTGVGERCGGGGAGGDVVLEYPFFDATSPSTLPLRPLVGGERRMGMEGVECEHEMEMERELGGVMEWMEEVGGGSGEEEEEEVGEVGEQMVGKEVLVGMGIGMTGVVIH